MMRSALRALGTHSANTLMIGDRMDTDIRAGLEAGLQTILVLSGISADSTAEQYPYRPTRVISSIADLVGQSADPFTTVGGAE
jgi:NagD protein